MSLFAYLLDTLKLKIHYLVMISYKILWFLSDNRNNLYNYSFGLYVR